jgi:thioester reductase-like protein
LYDRYKKEIKDSAVFDRLKTRLGMKRFRSTLKRKIKLVAMDLAKPDLGLTPEAREALIRNINVIINCAGTTDFDMRLDL